MTKNNGKIITHTKVTQRFSGIGNDNEEFYIILERAFIAFFKKIDVCQYQEELDNYFYNKGKEIQYFFIFDTKLSEKINEDIQKAKDSDRKWELIMARCGLAYDYEDVKTYSERLSTKKIEREITTYFQNKKIYPYASMDFRESGKIIMRYTNKEAFSLTVQETDKSFKEYISVIEKYELSKNYRINPRNKKITLIKNGKLDLIELFSRTKDKDREVLKKFFIEKAYGENGYAIDKIVTANYIIYSEIYPSNIDYNRKYLTTNTTSLNIKILLDDLKVIEKMGNLPNLEIITKGKGDKKISYRLFYLKNGEKKDITNYLEFKENILNNNDINKEQKELLHKIIKQSLPIKGITLSGRKDKGSNTITSFFHIPKKTHEEYIGAILKKEIWDLMAISGDDYDLEQMKTLINDAIKNGIPSTIQRRLRDRILYESELMVEEIK